MGTCTNARCNTCMVTEPQGIIEPALLVSAEGGNSNPASLVSLCMCMCDENSKRTFPALHSHVVRLSPAACVYWKVLH